MSRMQVQDLENAETYLKTAIGKAKERGQTYNLFQIIDQRARLMFIKNTIKKDNFNSSEIKLAISDLGGLIDNSKSELIYIYRSVPLIRDFLEEKIDVIDEEIRAALRDLLQRIKLAGEDFQHLQRSQKGETAILKKALADALTVIAYG
jgi:hypothetical protein